MMALFAKYYEDNQVKEDEMGGACGMLGDEINSFRILVGKPEV
jgi:hypothetical protein